MVCARCICGWGVYHGSRCQHGRPLRSCTAGCSRPRGPGHHRHPARLRSRSARRPWQAQPLQQDADPGATSAVSAAVPIGDVTAKPATATAFQSLRQDGGCAACGDSSNSGGTMLCVLLPCAHQSICRRCLGIRLSTHHTPKCPRCLVVIHGHQQCPGGGYSTSAQGSRARRKC